MRVDRKKHTGYFPEHPNTCQPPRSHMTNESDLAAIRPNGQAAPSHPTNAGAPDRLAQMDKQADIVINKWTFGGLVANLLPPPLDAVAVAAAFARMGVRLGQVYGDQVSLHELKPIGKAMAKGVGTVTIAGKIGTDVFKYVPGVNIWVALLIQPPIVAAIAHSVGHAFKQYYHQRLTQGQDLTPDELRAITETALRQRIG